MDLSLAMCLKRGHFLIECHRFNSLCALCVNLHKCQVLKPVFVPKARRETAAERVRLEQEEKDKAQKRNIEKVNLPADVVLNITRYSANCDSTVLWPDCAVLLQFM